MTHTPHALFPGIDGMAPRGRLTADGCCPPTLCQIDPCGLICNFVQQMPRGPLWDGPKAQTVARYNAGNAPVECGPDDASDDPTCVTLVDHAVYSANRLLDMLTDALAPAIRESSPHTAYATLDDWLARLGWRDCFDCACRDPGMAGLSPIEVLGVIDGCDVPICAAPQYPAELVCAVKHGIVVSLARASLGIIRTIDAINYVIAPLEARIDAGHETALALDPRYCSDDDGTTDGLECSSTMRSFGFTIRRIAGDIAACDPTPCPREAPARVQAYYDTTPEDMAGLPPRLWPGVMAAECIVRSLMPPGARITLQRIY